MGFFTLKKPLRGHRRVEKDIHPHVFLKHRGFASDKTIPLTDSVTFASDFSRPQSPYLENGGSVVGKVK